MCSHESEWVKLVLRLFPSCTGIQNSSHGSDLVTLWHTERWSSHFCFSVLTFFFLLCLWVVGFLVGLCVVLFLIIIFYLLFFLLSQLCHLVDRCFQSLLAVNSTGVRTYTGQSWVQQMWNMLCFASSRHTMYPSVGNALKFAKMLH